MVVPYWPFVRNIVFQGICFLFFENIYGQEKLQITDFSYLWC